MNRSEAIKNLLINRTHPDLAAMYNAHMEVQVNVAQDGGERIDGDYKGRIWHGWTDGITTWKSFRIPHNAKTEPTDNDYDIKFDLAMHAEGIGMTGWDWHNKVSRWVAFDFDAITGHSDKHEKKLGDAELKRIQEVVSNIPWITVRASTGGKGLHLYVYLDPPVKTENHTEHAAVARSILGMLASMTGFDFQSKVDVIGGNMWVWHRKMINNPNGLKLIRQGSSLDTIPGNWREHIDVISNRKRKTVPSFITDQGQADEIQRLFDEVTGQKSRIPLDDEHQRLIKFLHDINSQSWWDQDHHMLITHTKYLLRAHTELGLKGIFKTNSPGTEDEQNCYCFALRGGAWVVRRYTPGVAEESTWDQDGNGWTRCWFNQVPTLPIASRSMGGIEHKTGGYVFREAEIANKALESLGVFTKLPTWLSTRRAKLKEHRDGKRMLFEITHDPNDRADEMQGWLAEKGVWTRIFNLPHANIAEPEIGNYDDLVRHLITETGEDYGWLLKSDRQWRVEPLVHVRTFLKSLNLKQLEADSILGSAIAKPWRLVCRPFQPEILGDRDWNRNAPQLAHVPSQSDNLSYPTWLKVLNHCGKGLDDAVKNNPWAKANGILTGADYLKCWISSLFKEPMEPLPYLFFYGPQNSGKSIFHESLGLLVTCGVTRADNAITNQQGFNGELENAILCVIEETDLGRDKKANERIKDWVTSRNLPLHRKGATQYTVINYTHWVQCGNGPHMCAIFPGDTRITMIFVDNLDPIELIPKKQLINDLGKEASDFLAAILAVELPPSGDRLNIPVIETGEKRNAAAANRTYLEIFLEENCHHVTGKIIKFGELYERFQEWIDADELRNWSKKRVGRELPTHYPKGRSRADNQVIVGNISWTAKNPDEPILPKLALIGDHLEVVL